jgi:proline dehydrogenase
VTKAVDRKNFVWIDMEDTKYTDRTIDLYTQIRSHFPNVGLCVQAYLHRTRDDLQKLISIAAAIRLVKGCYAEPPNLVFQKKNDVDENFFQLCLELLQGAQQNRARVGIATHDQILIERILKEMAARNIPRETGEVQMLYGIRSADQFRLRNEGVPVRCLISYGSYWFPWYMRRLAERPANVIFVLRNLFEP